MAVEILIGCWIWLGALAALALILAGAMSSRGELE
jgi:hypothetical protein